MSVACGEQAAFEGDREGDSEGCQLAEYLGELEFCLMALGRVPHVPTRDGINVSTTHNVAQKLALAPDSCDYFDSKST